MKGAYSLVFGFGLSDAIMAQHRSAVRELDPVPAELFLSTCTGARKFRLPGLCGSAMHWDLGCRMPNTTLLLNSFTLNSEPSNLPSQLKAHSRFLGQTLQTHVVRAYDFQFSDWACQKLAPKNGN